KTKLYDVAGILLLENPGIGPGRFNRFAIQDITGSIDLPVDGTLLDIDDAVTFFILPIPPIILNAGHNYFLKYDLSPIVFTKTLKSGTTFQLTEKNNNQLAFGLKESQSLNFGDNIVNLANAIISVGFNTEFQHFTPTVGGSYQLIYSPIVTGFNFTLTFRI